MSSTAALFAHTFIIGIAVAAPVGAMGILCIQRTLARGWRAGVATGTGIATADAVYAGMAASGVAAVSSALVTWQTPLQLGGGAVLVYLGFTSLLAKATSGDESSIAAGQVEPAGYGSMYASAVLLTLTNPMTIMAFAAVFASSGLVAAPGAASAAVSTAGVAAGSLSWWLALITGVTLARHGLSAWALGWVTRLSGALLTAFGVAAIALALIPR